MAQKKKNTSSGSWMKERASVSKKSTSQPRTNKYRASSDNSKRPQAGTNGRYWRAGYTRRDGTKVKGHYVTKKNQS